MQTIDNKAHFILEANPKKNQCIIHANEAFFKNAALIMGAMFITQKPFRESFIKTFIMSFMFTAIENLERQNMHDHALLVTNIIRESLKNELDSKGY